MSIIHIDSKKRDEGTSSNFSYTLDSAIKNVKSVELLSLRIFNSVYTINSSNNVFPLAVANADDPTNHFTIPEGSYTIVELLAVLQSEFDDRLGDPPVITYDEKQLKIVLEVAQSTDPYYFNFFTFGGPWRELGFNQELYEFENEETFIAPNILNLGMPLYINVLIPELGVGVRSNNINDSTFIIPVNGNRGELIEYDRNRHFKQKIITGRNINLFNLHVSLVDENNSLIELNNTDWDMLLYVETN